MLQVDADNVVLDNAWLWRADHIQTGQLVRGQNPCQVKQMLVSSACPGGCYHHWPECGGLRLQS